MTYSQKIYIEITHRDWPLKIEITNSRIICKQQTDAIEYD